MKCRILKMAEYPIAVLTVNDIHYLRYHMPRCIEDDYGFMLGVIPPTGLAEAREEILEEMSEEFKEIIADAKTNKYDWIRFDEDALVPL